MGNLSNLTGFFLPIFNNCKSCKRVIYADDNQLKRHLWQKHDFTEIEEKAFEVGIIQDNTKFHNRAFLIDKLVEKFKVR